MIWKILFVIYAFVIVGLSFLGLDAALSSQATNTEAFVDTLVEIVLVFALVYTFALGWKKSLISERFNKWFFKFSVASFVLMAVFLYKDIYTPMYSDMLLQAMENGMVPRHWDFQMYLAMTRMEAFIFVIISLVLIYAPLFLGMYHYTKHMTELGVAKHSGRKCFATYLVASQVFILSAIFLGVSGDVVNYNIFDCLSILSGILIGVGVLGYAFSIEILTQAFWRVVLPVCVVIELLPASFFTTDFKNAIGYTVSESSPIYMITSYALTAVAIYMVYMYACTNVVFKKQLGS